MDVYIEYGLDFDNNRFGLGKSTEIEYADGTEKRTTQKISIGNKIYYIRFWIFKRVFVLSCKDGLEIVKKNRNNFKFVFGIHGKLPE